MSGPGRKDDQGKLRWGLLRKSLVKPLESVIKVLMYGANRYGDENWQKVENGAVRYRDALDRHLAEIDKGNLVDQDTGEPHLAHVATNALFLLWLHQQHQEALEASWYPHRGDTPRPNGGVRVQAELRNGEKITAQAGDFEWHVDPQWPSGYDIIRWRYA